MRAVMPIRPFLAGEAFEPEVVSTMALAFEKTCEALNLCPKDDPITRLVAKKIIDLTQRGIRDPDTLSAMALKEFKSSS
jgi:hypothetical protein